MKAIATFAPVGPDTDYIPHLEPLRSKYREVAGLYQFREAGNSKLKILRIQA